MEIVSNGARVIKHRAVEKKQRSPASERKARGAAKGPAKERNAGRSRKAVESRSPEGPVNHCLMSAAGLMNLKLGRKLQRETSRRDVEELDLGSVNRWPEHRDQLHGMHCEYLF